MVDKTFILTDKIEFVPDENLEGELNFNLRATGYVFNKTLEYSIYRENLVKEFGIGKSCKVNRTYTQKIVRTLKKQKPFLKKAESTCIQASTDRLIKAYEGFYDGRTGRWMLVCRWILLFLGMVFVFLEFLRFFVCKCG